MAVGKYSTPAPLGCKSCPEEIGLELAYNAKERIVDVTIRPPRRAKAHSRTELARNPTLSFATDLKLS